MSRNSKDTVFIFIYSFIPPLLAFGYSFTCFYFLFLKHIPFRLNVPRALPVHDDLSDAAFDAIMQKDYLEARTGNFYDKEVFDELQSDLS